MGSTQVGPVAIDALARLHPLEDSQHDKHADAGGGDTDHALELRDEEPGFAVCGGEGALGVAS